MADEIIERLRTGISLDGTTVRGRGAVGELLMPDIFADQQARVERMELETRSWHVWTMEDGRARRVRLFLDRDEAVQAAELV